VSELAFLSPCEARAEAGFVPRAASPLARALEGAHGIRDLSLLGKLEVRGAPPSGVEADIDVLQITPARALLICPSERCAELRDSLPGLVVDLTGALAGIALESAELMRRLTDLDLAALPAAGKVADVPAIVAAAGGGFRIFFPQEYGHSVVEAVRDLQEGFA
jgi:hypothetical protein